MRNQATEIGKMVSDKLYEKWHNFNLIAFMFFFLFFFSQFRKDQQGCNCGLTSPPK